MPSNIRNYVGLCVLALAIGLISAYFNFDTASAQMERLGGAKTLLIVEGIGFAISIGLITAVAWGRQNWARWVQLILWLITLLSLALGFQKLLETGSFQLGTAALQMVLRGGALFFVFTGDAPAWFKREDRAA